MLLGLRASWGAAHGVHGMCREAEFGGSTEMLLRPANAARLANLEYLSLYHNKLARLDHFETVSQCCLVRPGAGAMQRVVRNRAF